MSKMGISVISSYRGGYNFEAVGLSRSLVQEFFPGMPSRISGIGLRGVAGEGRRAARARPSTRTSIALPIGGFYKYRRGGEHHNFEGNLIHMLQAAVNTESYAKFKKYSEAVRRLPPINLRDLLDFKAERRAGADRRGRSRSPRSASASSRPACRWARSAPRRTRRCPSP